MWLHFLTVQQLIVTQTIFVYTFGISIVPHHFEFNTFLVFFEVLSRFEPGTFRSWSRLTNVPPCFPLFNQLIFFRMTNYLAIIVLIACTGYVSCRPSDGALRSSSLCKIVPAGTTSCSVVSSISCLDVAYLQVLS